MMLFFIIIGLIALLILAIVWRKQEDKDAKIFELELEVKMKDEIIDSLKDNMKELSDSNYELASTIRKRLK